MDRCGRSFCPVRRGGAPGESSWPAQPASGAGVDVVLGDVEDLSVADLDQIVARPLLDDVDLIAGGEDHLGGLGILLEPVVHEHVLRNRGHLSDLRTNGSWIYGRRSRGCQVEPPGRAGQRMTTSTS